MTDYYINEKVNMDNYLAKFEKVPISDILEPKPGRICYHSSYWIITDNEEVLFFRKGHNSPQCNMNENIATGFLKSFPNTYTCRLLPIVYLKHNCADYVF